MKGGRKRQERRKIMCKEAEIETEKEAQTQRMRERGYKSNSER